MRDTDESLMKSFAIHRDEAAFRTLAERYLGLVFHTALRRTNNRPGEMDLQRPSASRITARYDKGQQCLLQRRRVRSYFDTSVHLSIPSGSSAILFKWP